MSLLSSLLGAPVEAAKPAKDEPASDLPAGLPRPGKMPRPYESFVGPTKEQEKAARKEKKKKAKRAKKLKLHPMDPGPTFYRRAEVIIDKALVRGVGGLTFTAQAPPGPARLMRLPFYPANDNDAFNGSDGIDSVGDDPILKIPLQNTGGGILPSQISSAPVKMITPIVDYGRYKVVGVQINYQYNYAPKDALGAFVPPFLPGGPPFIANPFAKVGPVAISVKNLQVYNGQQLFIVNQNNFLDGEELRALPSLGSSGFTGGVGGGWGGLVGPRYQGQRPWQTAAFRQQFVGLRDYPVIDEVAQVSIEVQAFTSALYPSTSIVVPVTVSLVVEMMEDRVFGNPLNPSLASRAGANVKVGAKEVGKKEGRSQLEIHALRYRRDQ